MELTFALPQFVKLMYIIHHAFTAIKKSHVDCSGLAVRLIKLKEQIFADEVIRISADHVTRIASYRLPLLRYVPLNVESRN